MKSDVSRIDGEGKAELALEFGVSHTKESERFDSKDDVIKVALVSANGNRFVLSACVLISEVMNCSDRVRVTLTDANSNRVASLSFKCSVARVLRFSDFSAGELTLQVSGHVPDRCSARLVCGGGAEGLRVLYEGTADPSAGVRGVRIRLSPCASAVTSDDMENAFIELVGGDYYSLLPFVFEQQHGRWYSASCGGESSFGRISVTVHASSELRNQVVPRSRSVAQIERLYWVYLVSKEPMCEHHHSRIRTYIDDGGVKHVWLSGPSRGKVLHTKTAWEHPYLASSKYTVDLDKTGELSFTDSENRRRQDPRALPIGWSVSTDSKSFLNNGYSTELDPRGLPPTYTCSLKKSGGEVMPIFTNDDGRETTKDPRASASNEEYIAWRESAFQGYARVMVTGA